MTLAGLVISQCPRYRFEITLRSCLTKHFRTDSSTMDQPILFVMYQHKLYYLFLNRPIMQNTIMRNFWCSAGGRALRDIFWGGNQLYNNRLRRRSDWFLLVWTCFVKHVLGEILNRLNHRQWCCRGTCMLSLQVLETHQSGTATPYCSKKRTRWSPASDNRFYQGLHALQRSKIRSGRSGYTEFEFFEYARSVHRRFIVSIAFKNSRQFTEPVVCKHDLGWCHQFAVSLPEMYLKSLPCRYVCI